MELPIALSRLKEIPLSLIIYGDLQDAISSRSQETCVYVLFKLLEYPSPSWSSLRTKPNYQNRTERRGKIWFKRDSSRFSVVPIPSSSTDSFPDRNHIERVGPDIYVIGGSYKQPSSSVRIFDCRSHTWRDGPNMTMAREDAVITVLLDEKIYVLGGCDIDHYYANWIEVFDLKNKSWTALPGPGADLRNHLRKYNNQYYIVNVFEGKLYLVADEKEYSYKPKNGTWKLVREKSSFVSKPVQVWVKMGNVIYGCSNLGYLMWSNYENEGIDKWRKIKGLENLREDPTIGLKTGSQFGVMDYGGQLLVMWDHSDSSSSKIRYAKISLESRRSGREVWGKVECVGVLTFPVELYHWFNCLTASV